MLLALNIQSHSDVLKTKAQKKRYADFIRLLRDHDLVVTQETQPTAAVATTIGQQPQSSSTSPPTVKQTLRKIVKELLEKYEITRPRAFTIAKFNRLKILPLSTSIPIVSPNRNYLKRLEEIELKKEEEKKKMLEKEVDKKKKKIMKSDEDASYSVGKTGQSRQRNPDKEWLSKDSVGTKFSRDFGMFESDIGDRGKVGWGGWSVLILVCSLKVISISWCLDLWKDPATLGDICGQDF